MMAHISFRHLIIFIISCYFWVIQAEKDFQFENSSNSQVTTWTEAHEEPKKSSVQKNLYFKEMSQCPYSESKIILSLVLKSYDWNSIPKNKKTRALNKISKFFAVPKDYIKLESTSKRDIYEMTKRSIKRGVNHCNNAHSLGKVEFMIGCGQTYFIIGEPISNQIGHQIKDGSIDDIVGLNFGWWVIWKKKVNNRVQRYRRQAEGSGDAEDYDYDDEDYDTEEEQVTDLPVSTTHAHRHHHGIKPPYVDKKSDGNQKILSIDTNLLGTNLSKFKKNDIKPLQQQQQQQQQQLVNENISNNKNKSKNILNIKNSNKTNPDDIVKSDLSKLESDITKTIENTKRFKELQLEAIENEMKRENDLKNQIYSSNLNRNINDGNNENISTKLNNHSLISNSNINRNIKNNYHKSNNNSPNDDDYIIEDIATDVQTDFTPITSITSEKIHNHNNNNNQNLSSTHKIDNHSNVNLKLINSNNNSVTSSNNKNTSITQKIGSLEQTTIQQQQQSSTVPSIFITKKPTRDETTFISFTEDTISKNQIQNFSSPTTIITTTTTPPSLQSTKLTATNTIVNSIPTTTTTTTTTIKTVTITDTDNINTIAPTTTATLTPFINNKNKLHNHNNNNNNNNTKFISTGTLNTAATTTTTTINAIKTPPPTTTISTTEFSSITTTPSTVHTTSTTTTVETISEPTSMLPSVLTKKDDTNELSKASSTPTIIRSHEEDEYEDRDDDTTVLPDIQQETTVSRVSSFGTTTQSTPTLSGTVAPSTIPFLTTTTTTTTPATTTGTTAITTSTTTLKATTPSTTTTTTVAPTPITEIIEPEVPVNHPPVIRNRYPKQAVTSGKPFNFVVPLETFYDEEDGTNLTMKLLDEKGNELKSSSWIQFNPNTKEIYGLPLELAVSRWQYKLIAIDSKNSSVTETIDITVQQHKGQRSVNHEITLIVKLQQKYEKSVDWQIRVVKGIADTLNDKTLSHIVVRDIRHPPNSETATFIYTNETLSKDKCPEEKLDELVQRLEPRKLSDSMYPELAVKSVTANPVGPCIKPQQPKPKPTPFMTINKQPMPRNQVDRVNATIGQLLVFKVPPDTFFDPEDHTDLKLSLLTINREEIKPTHWLQFDSKNHEFYGVPKYSDVGTEEYLLVAEDSGGLTANDALLVVVNHPPKRNYSLMFKMTLGMSYEEFNKAAVQRKFVEKLAQLFGDQTTSYIQIRPMPINYNSIENTGQKNVAVVFYNTTLIQTHNKCPDDDIDRFRKVYFIPNTNIVNDKVKKTIGHEFHVKNLTITMVPSNCNAPTDNIPNQGTATKTEDKKKPSFPDDYLLTFILPVVIILAMLLLASIIACVLHRRRLTGKMELGDEEERRSFRSKGIPVIFQDELDEKPEIGNKSPIILKDEKPPLLPPSYNSTNLDGDNDVDEYVPPPAVVMGGREARGKSPVTPSYRKPPPYVSP